MANVEIKRNMRKQDYVLWCKAEIIKTMCVPIFCFWEFGEEMIAIEVRLGPRTKLW